MEFNVGVPMSGSKNYLGQLAYILVISTKLKM